VANIQLAKFGNRMWERLRFTAVAGVPAAAAQAALAEEAGAQRQRCDSLGFACEFIGKFGTKVGRRSTCLSHEAGSIDYI
jgi:hypothetical protein